MEETVTENAEVVVETAVNNTDPAQALNLVHDVMNGSIYLMGFSFILGVVFTIFILLILDFMRRNKQDDE